MNEALTLSTLAHTWLLDIDGTIVKHNGYKIDGVDSFLPGAAEFLRSIPKEDMIIFLTSRSEEYQKLTIDFFESHKIKYNYIIFNVPQGERILINDNKPSGLYMSRAICIQRDSEVKINWNIDVNL